MARAWLMLLLLLSCYCTTSRAAHVDPYENLKQLMKLSSSLNPEDTTINYINGTVYSVQPGQRSVKLFYFEGFNIGRKSPLSTGDYQSYSCELLVYRDPVSGQILNTWANPFTLKPNEVFPVANYPVNGKQTKEATPVAKHVTGEITVYNSDATLRYINPLQPDEYPKYSAGRYYIGAEFFEFFGRQKELDDPTKDSVNVSATWHRVSQWLPWMELGEAKGHLFYSAFAWKIPSFSDFPKDLLDLLKEKFPKFFKPPSDFNIPNETTWTVFKRIITERRASGSADIIFRPDLVEPNTTPHRPCLDQSLKSLLLRQEEFRAAWDGYVYSFTEDQQPIHLFNVKGHFKGNIKSSGVDFVFDFQVDGLYLDSKSGEEIGLWTNPYTNQTIPVPTIQFSNSITLPRDDLVSFPIPPSNEIGLSGVSSSPGTDSFHTSGLMLVFSEKYLLPKATLPAPFYGTYTSVSSWLPWMKMETIPGYMTFRTNVRNDEIGMEKNYNSVALFKPRPKIK